MQSTRTSEPSAKSCVNIYFAAEGFSEDLQQELVSIEYQQDRIFIAKSKQDNVHLWTQCVGFNATIHKFDSISQAVEILKSQTYMPQGSTEKVLQKRWAHCSHENFRRAELIQEKLFKFKYKEMTFLEDHKDNIWGIWFLIDKNTLACASKTNSSLPLGLVQFQEDKVNPPSRAYLKLWEFFTVYKTYPLPTETVLDLGSCPGGWTWVLAQLGCKVISVDKAPIEARISALPNVQYLKKDAFTLKAEDVPKIDWLFSDIICFPEKLLELITYWSHATTISNFVCTIKFQGPTDNNALELFRKIPNAKIYHLCHNKHEVTFYLKRSI